MNLKLINDDCMNVMRDYPDDYFDLAIVDPPYNLARFKNGLREGDRIAGNQTGNSNLWNNNEPTPEYFKELFRVSLNQIIWGANNFILPPTEYFCIWNKKQTVDNFATAEYAWVSMGLKKPAKMFDYGIHQHNADKGKIHPTQKPVKLYQWLYDNYSKQGQKILDTHLGSGSSAIAAYYAQMSEFVGVELDADYFSAAKARINQETKQVDMFLEVG